MVDNNVGDGEDAGGLDLGHGSPLELFGGETIHLSGRYP
jgi:hypothetical protein